MSPISKASDNIPIHFSTKAASPESWGEIILINGTRSSGKTTLVNKVVEKLTHFRTLNRKAHVELILAKLDELFFKDLLQQAREMTGEPIKDSIALYHLSASLIKDESTKNRILAIRQKFDEIVKSVHFINSYNILLFTSYFHEMQPHLIAGDTYIIDEGLTSSDEAYATFRACCQDYPNVKRVLLYNTINDNFLKCCERNRKFREFIDHYASPKEAQEAIRKLEKESQGSTSTYRFPKEIIQNYLQYYLVKPHCESNEKILGILKREELEILFNQIATAQNELCIYLESKNFLQINSSHRMDAQKELETFCQGANTLYVSSKLNNDLILDGTEIQMLSNLENPDFLRQFLKDLFPKPFTRQ